MHRKKAHNEEKEPFLENILSILRFKKIIKFIPENSKVLDLGCGFNASFLKKIEYKNCERFGLDISINKNLNSNNLFLVEHDLNQVLPFGDSTFNIVTSLANLEHLKDPERIIKDIYRVLKPGGKILMTTPTIYSKPVLEFLSFRLHLISENEIKDHKNYFNKRLLFNLYKKAGFIEIKHNYFQFFMNNFISGVK